MPRRYPVFRLRRLFIFSVMLIATLLIFGNRMKTFLNRGNDSGEKSSVQGIGNPLIVEPVSNDDMQNKNDERHMRLSRLFPVKTNHLKDKYNLLQMVLNPKGARILPKTDSISPHTTTQSQTEKYFVYNRKCKMVLVDPFSEEVLQMYSPTKLKECSKESALFHLRFDAVHQVYHIDVDIDIVPRFWTTVENFKCNYREVLRGTNSSADFYSNLGPQIYFQQNTSLPRNISYIIVECHDAVNESYILQQDAFPLIQVPDLSQPGFNQKPEPEPKPKPETVLEQIKNKTSYNILDRQPSVIILGLDTMSRINFQRTMPITAQFVRTQGWVEMQGYNKMDHSTNANLKAVLTGYPRDYFRWACEDCSDQAPWIWKYYNEAGYKTALAEDVRESAFNYSEKYGFRQVPTTYYLRPFILGIGATMKNFLRFGYKYCIGRRLSISYVYTFCQQFVERQIKELQKPAFGFFWSCSFTHDLFFSATSLDARFTEYLQSLKDQQLFEHAIVILMSDHGALRDHLATTRDGFLEARLPMLHIYLPPWFRRAYPNYYLALQQNRNRLCSNYDLHHTLKHILQLNATRVEDLQNKTHCSTSQSLLHLLPKHRGCEDACIPEHYCTCNTFIEESCSGEMYESVKLALSQINQYLIRNALNLLCKRAFLEDLDKCELKLIHFKNLKSTFRLSFRTFPLKGKFQMTVDYNSETKQIENLNLNDISRLNTYRNESECVEDKMAKKFCHCFNDSPKNFDDLKWINYRMENNTILLPEKFIEPLEENKNKDADHVEFI